MADTENTAASVKELLDRAVTAQNKALETLDFLRRSLEQTTELKETEIDGLSNVLGYVRQQVDEAGDATDRATMKVRSEG